MDQDRIKIEFNDDKSVARLSFVSASGQSGGLDLRAEQLLKLVQGLGKAHQMMVAGQQSPAPEGAPIEAILDAQWSASPEMMGEASLLSFVHPAFGPLGFMFTMPEVEKMAAALSAQVEFARDSKKTRQ